MVIFYAVSTIILFNDVGWKRSKARAWVYFISSYSLYECS